MISGYGLLNWIEIATEKLIRMKKDTEANSNQAAHLNTMVCLWAGCQVECIFFQLP